MSPRATTVPSIDELLARMTPEEKLQVANRLRETAWELVTVGVRMREPDLGEAEVQERVRQLFSRVDD